MRTLKQRILLASLQRPTASRGNCSSKGRLFTVADITKKGSDIQSNTPKSISKMLHILNILTDHIATSQLDTITSQVTGDYMILKNTKKNKNYVEIG